MNGTGGGGNGTIQTLHKIRGDYNYYTYEENKYLLIG